MEDSYQHSEILHHWVLSEYSKDLNNVNFYKLIIGIVLFAKWFHHTLEIVINKISNGYRFYHASEKFYNRSNRRGVVEEIQILKKTQEIIN